MSEISAVARGGIDEVNAILPLGRDGAAEEVAGLVALPRHRLVRHLAGATIDINGAANIR